MGFSIEAIKYSFGYFADMQVPHLDDPAVAKEKFLSEYRVSNISSLDAYLKAIAVDIPVAATIGEFATFNSSITWCRGCSKRRLMQKVFFAGGICYLLEIAAHNEAVIGRAYTDRMVVILLQDRTNEMPILYKKLWRLFQIQKRNATIKYSVAAPVFLSSFAFHHITITAEQYITLKDTAGACISREEASPDYSPEVCYAECISEHRSVDANCLQYDQEPSSPNTIPKHPGNYCNIFDSRNGNGFYERMDAENTLDDRPDAILQRQKCGGQCPPQCDRLMYGLTSKSKLEEDDFPNEYLYLSKKARERNMSTVGLVLTHQGVYQGGILTLKQVSTITPAGLISNLGGALGLFVGGTAMTFVQLIMFLVKLVLEKKSRKLVPVPGKGVIYSVP